MENNEQMESFYYENRNNSGQYGGRYNNSNQNNRQRYNHNYGRNQNYRNHNNYRNNNNNNNNNNRDHTNQHYSKPGRSYSQQPPHPHNEDLPPRFRKNRQALNYSQNENTQTLSSNFHHENPGPSVDFREHNGGIIESFNHLNIIPDKSHQQNKQMSQNSSKDIDPRFIPSSSTSESKKFFTNNIKINQKRNDKWENDRTLTDSESQREIMDELLRKSKYECMICCDVIKTHDRTWNCTSCHNIFHLKCTQQWARKSSVTPDEQANSSSSNTTVDLNSNLDFPSNQANRNDGQNVSNNTKNGEWRCPTCQNVQKTFPNAYYCFCGKTRDPEPSRYRVPHSCEKSCLKNLDSFNIKIENAEYFTCPHKCILRCHPGKCPQCTAKIERCCACKKTKMNLKCVSKLSDVKCPEPCQKMLDCLKHRCQKNCHFGECDPCDQVFDDSCYCGKKTKEGIRCVDFEPGFCCEEKCSKLYSCEKHECQKNCHPESCGTCPFSPQNVSHCPCGKTRLSSIANYKPRLNCSDPIPICGQICDKILPCSGDEDKPHRCKSFCHIGDCPPCDLSTVIRCFCGANSKKVNCQDLESRNFRCKRKCNKKLMCGRHKCLKECCTEKEHPCRQTCGRKLVCGQHTCEEPCHKVCGSCPNVIWTEVYCNCGAEFLPPPLPCGTKRPPCNKPCSRPHGCDHPPTHKCHDDPECPPCVEFVSRMCYGGHEIRNSVPCYDKGVSCGRFCQKPLPCGLHKCSKMCHDGDCPPCNQKCAKIRPDCLHPCGLPCHQSTIEMCPESPCRAKIKVYCECEFKCKDVECNDVIDSRRFQQHLDNLMHRYSFNTSITLEEMKEIVRNNIKHSLECDQDCAKEKRNRNLAEALGIDPNNQSAINFVRYSDQLRNEARSNPQFILNVHDKFVKLIDAFKQTNQKIMCYNFPAMNRNNRETIHNYAVHYGLKTESVDKEPNRSVIITANKLSSVPKTTLLESVGIDIRELRPKQSVVKYKTASEESKNKKVINHFDD